MASGRLGRKIVLSLSCARKGFLPDARLFTTRSKQIGSSSQIKVLGLTLAGVIGGYAVYRKAVAHIQQIPALDAVYAKEKSKDPVEEQERIHSHREKRFLSFASIEYEGNVYMTPQDFLESITNENPRSRLSRQHLQKSDVEKYLKNTPSRKKSSFMLFRNLNDQGLISFTEYLFLLCVLTKPKSGFHIAFNMFDLDGDQKVDKKEFLVLEKLLAHTSNSGIESTEDLLGAGKVVGRPNIWTLLRNSSDDGGAQSVIDTTLTVHFFGAKGKEVLNYEDFHRFMENLQTEVLELEFAEFSHGMPSIKEEEFAKILLRYTVLTKEEHEDYLDRLRSRVQHVKGITFKDFKEFCQFLNNIDDFALAMRIYTYADHPISEVDFKRAVKACTGQNLNSHLVHVVFQLFDCDGDGKLSHREFISVMRERVHRGTKTLSHNKWENYKQCVKNEIRNA